MGLNPLILDVFLESVSHLLWDEYVLSLFAAFGVPKGSRKNKLSFIRANYLILKGAPIYLP
jgi:hypothetical protein